MLHRSLTELESLPSAMLRRAKISSGRWSLTFLEGEGKSSFMGQREFAARVCALARRLLALSKPGEPILLVYPPGPDFLVGFMACLTANRPAVPINPPRRNRLIERVDSIIADSGATLALTTSSLLVDQPWWQKDDTPLSRLSWLPTDQSTADGTVETEVPQLGSDDIAFIQYTSGSTSEPKGVTITHGNLIWCLEEMSKVWRIDEASVMVSWLPAFHDLGLIFGLLQPLYNGCASIAMAPARFLQSPILWLDAISRHRGTHTAAPSFAYDACVRRVTETQQAGLDLSSLRVAMNAAEPIDASVVAAFEKRFGPNGYGPRVSSPAYGLAESTLAITANPAGQAPVILDLDVVQVEAFNRVVVLTENSSSSRAFVGSGQTLPGTTIKIVDPHSCRVLSDGQIGEIWASGPTISKAYWNKPQISAEVLGARLFHDDGSRYLRTGDLGFMHKGELFVTGRLKDLIIIRGVNYYPQDLERAAFRSHLALRPECCAAFSLVRTTIAAEQLVIVQEVERACRKNAPKPLFDAIRDAIWQGFGLVPERIVLIEPGSIPRTSSGKIRRAATCTALLEKTLPVIEIWEQPSTLNGAPASELEILVEKAPLRNWLLGWLANRLGVSPKHIDPDESFAVFGLDSVSAAALATALGLRTGRKLSQTVVWDHPSPNRLLRHLGGSEVDATIIRRLPIRERAKGSDIDELLDQIEQESYAGQ